MSSFRPSPTEHRYLIGLKAPQQVEEAVDRLKCRASKCGFVSDPFEAMVPLWESAATIRPPVPGLLPPCEAPILVSRTPLKTEDGQISYLPVDSGRWFERLEASLIGLSGKSTDRKETKALVEIERNCVFYPEFRGIPIAFPKPGGENVRIPPVKRTVSLRWRTLILECLLVEWAADRPWYLSTAWTVQWRRRLRRAP